MELHDALLGYYILGDIFVLRFSGKTEKMFRMTWHRLKQSHPYFHVKYVPEAGKQLLFPY